ncbi:MAG: hypothetical protein IJ125_02090 [Atopobiaceae bacterium]|nr:hypothetical protein [Atopobiaceae bacterium]
MDGFSQADASLARAVTENNARSPLVEATTHVAFETFHPSLAAVYVAGVLALTMFAIHPIITTLSLISAVLCSVVCRGSAATFRDMRWQLPLALIVAVANPFFSASGSTLLFKLGLLAVYQESLFFGACMGAMLVATLMWLAVAGVMLPTERLLTLFGGVLPTLGLMISMVARLVPQLVKRGQEFRAVHAANTGHEALATTSTAETNSGCASPDAHADNPTPKTTLRERVAYGARMSGVLMAWSMADSLDSADAMRARGWSATSKRTSYQPSHFDLRDLIALSLLCVLLVIVGLLAWVACSQFRFYPTTSQLVVWWGHIPCAAYLLLGAILSLRERLSWM